MADPMLPDEMLAGLRDIRLPDIAPGGALAELAVAIGLGLLIACAASFLLPLITRPATVSQPTAHDELARIRALPEAERSVALLHLIRNRNAGAAHELTERLYPPGDFPTVAELEQLVKAAPHA